MAVIRTFNRQISPSGQPGVRQIDARLGGETEAATARLAGAIGQGIDTTLTRVRTGEIQEQRKLEKEAAEAAELEKRRQHATMLTERTTSATMEFEEQYQSFRQEAPPGAAGFRQNVETFVDERIDGMLEEVKDDPAAHFDLSQKMAGIRQRMVLRAASDERAAALTHAEQTFGAGVDALSSAVVSNPGELDSYVDQAVAMIEDQAPFMTAEERAETAHRAKSVLANSAIAGMMESDPQAVIDDLNSGRYDGMIDGGDKSTALRRANAEMDRREAKHQARLNAQKKVVAGEVKDAVYVMDRGHIPANFHEVQAAAAQFPELKQVVDEAFEDAQDVARFSRLPSEQRNALLRDASGNLNPSRRDLEREQRFAKRSAEVDRMLEDDPISAAVETGVIEAPGPIGESLAERRELAAIVEQTYGVPTSGLTKGEAQEFARQLDEMSTPEKLQQLGAMQEGLGDQRMRLMLKDIASDDPVTAAAVAVSVDNPSLAAEVFEGQKVLKATKGILPSSTGSDGYVTLANESLGDVLEFARPEDREAMVQSALAIEANRRNKLGLLTKDDFSPEVFQEVLGQVVGGVVEYNDEKIIPPSPDLDTDGFEQIMAEVTEDDIPNIGGPFLDREGDPVDWQTIQDSGHLKSFGQGRYFVFLGNRPLAGPNGGPAELNFGDHLNVLRSRLDTQRRRGFLSSFGLGGE